MITRYRLLEPVFTQHQARIAAGKPGGTSRELRVTSRDPRDPTSHESGVATRDPRAATSREPRACPGYVLSLFVFLAISGCATHARPAVPDQLLALNSHSLRLHFANRAAPAGRPLLVYATGDGGMHRKDLDTYRHLAALGDPIVGFDARDYVKHLGTHSPTTTPERLADDYGLIIARARQALGLTGHHPVVLVGVSRGAGLAVVAAARLRDVITGVVAVALTQEEEYVRWYRHLPLPHEPHRAVMVDVYEYLADLGDVPIAVVQSTHDRYLPASKARAQFGPDTASRWFQSIEAANHNFGGARNRMYEAIRAAVTWVTTRRDAPASQEADKLEAGSWKLVAESTSLRTRGATTRRLSSRREDSGCRREAPANGRGSFDPGRSVLRRRIPGLMRCGR
jgi:pimeloyl-ACP methyl ester carboxylesterase